MNLKNLKTKFRFLHTLGIGKDRDYFVENLSMLTSSGMNILDALDAINRSIKTRKMKKVIKNIRADIESGGWMWQALNDSHIFPSHTISLIRIGEKSGRLSKNLQIVGQQDKKDRIFKSRLRSAMMYPLFVMAVTVFVGIGIAWFILPQLSVVFNQLNLDLPLITEYLIKFGTFLGEYGMLVVPVFFLILVIVFYFIFYFPATRFIGQKFLFSLPGIKRLILEVEVSRFGYLLGTLLEAGLPVTHALDSLAQATDFPFYKKLYQHLKNEIQDGNSFKRSFDNFPDIDKFVPVPVQLLIGTGEQSGRLSKTLQEIGESYEIKIETTTKNLTVILEPILLVIIWLGVIGVALAVILPIYNLIGGLSDNNTINRPPPPVATAPAEEETVEELPTETEPAVEEQTIEERQEKLDQVNDQEVSLPKLRVSLPGNISHLNVRSEPTTSSEIVQKIPANEVYEYLGGEEGWYEIILPPENETGWVSGDYVELLQN